MHQTEHRYDIIIIGSSLGGLAAGAMLANKGYSVVVVDTVPKPGGRMGATQQNGYWIGWGQRDGLGSTDLAFIPHYIHDAAKQAGVELNSSPLSNRFFRLHWLPDGTTSELPAELVVPNNNDPMELLRQMVRCFSSVTAPDEVQSLAEELGAVLMKLRDTPLEEGASAAASFTPLPSRRFRRHRGAICSAPRWSAAAISPAASGAAGRKRRRRSIRSLIISSTITAISKTASNGRATRTLIRPRSRPGILSRSTVIR